MSCTSKDFFIIAGTYTGTGSKGIYVYQFNSETGNTTAVGHSDSVVNPSFVIVSGKYLYAVNETNGDNPGSVSAFEFDNSSGKIKFLNKHATGGDDPCHLAISSDGRWLAVANYSGGSLSVFPIAGDGSLKPYAQLIQHSGSSINKERQEKPHVHETVFTADDKYLISPDLGLDQVMVYKFDDKKEKPLTPAEPPFVASPAGSGPRHITFSPDGKYAYLIHELDGMVTVYNYKEGKFSQLQTIPTYPPGFDGVIDGCEIVVSPDGKFLYTSQRGDQNAITIFSIDKESGKLSKTGYQPTTGKGPRSFTIDPTGNYLLVAHQNSDNIIIFKRDKETGLLKLTSNQIKVPKPVCLQMVPVK